MDKKFLIKSINPNIDELSKIGFDKTYLNVGVNKHIFKSFKIFNLTSAQANILKQTALSIGTDCAVHRDVILGTVEFSDCILSGSISELHKIAKKLRLQPFRLNVLGDMLLEELNRHILNINIHNRSLCFDKPLLMGILNVTPDSFSDGGCYNSVEKAYLHYKQLICDGADIVDIGAESTRPEGQSITVEEELTRLLPVLKKIRENDKETIISIDTRNAQTAKLSIELGADIINDVSGLSWDKDMIDVILSNNCPIILGHCGFDVFDDINNLDCVSELLFYFEDKINLLLSLGFDKSKIIIDPCIGFGKSFEQNIEILKRVNEFKSFAVPLLIGHSRKSFIKKLFDIDNNELLDEYTATISNILFDKGVDIVRVHNIKKHKDSSIIRDLLF